MPNYKNAYGGLTHVDPRSNRNRITVRDSRGKIISVTETYGSYTHTKTYDSNGRANCVYKKNTK